MDDLTKYAADVIEFIAGGILFLTALIIWGYLWIPESLTGVIFTFATGLGEVSSLALGIGLLGITYTLGVFAEGASRVVTEWRLRHITVEVMRDQYDQIPAPALTKLRDARLSRSGPVARAGRFLRYRTCADCRALSSPQTGAETQPEPRTSSSAPTRCSRHLAAVEKRVKLTLIEHERERWRSIASRSTSGAKSIDAQLKRLRIERTLLLSLVLITIALASRASLARWVETGVNHDLRALWALALTSLLLSAVCAFLVNERFRRFLHTIDRSHALEEAHP